MKPIAYWHLLMTAIADPPLKTSTRLSARVYLPRVTGLALGGMCVGAAFWEQSEMAAGLWVLLLVNALIWPHVAYVLASRSRSPRRTEKASLLIDSLMGGFWVIAMQGNLLPSVLILAMLSMNNVATGGFPFLSLGLVAHLLGAMVGWALLGWHFSPESGFVVQLACIPFLVVYPLQIGTVTLRLAHELNRQRAELRWLSDNDALSGLYNRRFFEQRIAEEFENAKRHRATITLAVADIDHFKSINDNHGHAVGDAVIRAVGQVLRQQVRRADVVARIGGDEFVVLMPFTSTSEALELIGRLQTAFSHAITDDPRLAGTTISFGVAQPDSDMQSYQHWMELADKALYRAKTRKRGSVEVAGLDLQQE